MNISEFAKECGVTLVKCDSSWGGTIAYEDADYPNQSVTGFSTNNAAYKHWFESKFGKRAAMMVLKLLKETNDNN